MGIGSAGTSPLPRGDFAWTILIYSQITQPCISRYRYHLYLCINRDGRVLNLYFFQVKYKRAQQEVGEEF
jgi:hypothetical protein